MSEAPTGRLLKRGISEELEAGARALVLQEHPIPPDPESAKISELAAFCKKMGSVPKGWTKMKAAEKRATFSEIFCSEESDLIQDIVHYVENLPADKIPAEVEVRLENVGLNYFELGGILSRVVAERLFGKHENFRDWVESETGMGLRKARYLLGNYDKLVELGIPFSKFFGLGWTKVVAMLPVITEENVDEWVQRAKDMTLIQLQELVKAARQRSENEAGESGQEGSEAKAKQKKFNLYEDQARTVELTLEQMKNDLPTEHENVALEAICLAYLSGGAVVKRAAVEFDDREAGAVVMREVLTRLRSLATCDFDVLEPLFKILSEMFPNSDIEIAGDGTAY